MCSSRQFEYYIRFSYFVYYSVSQRIRMLPAILVYFFAIYFLRGQTGRDNLAYMGRRAIAKGEFFERLPASGSAASTVVNGKYAAVYVRRHEQWKVMIDTVSE